MKRRILLLLSMFTMLLSASAQTDVTKQYLTNAGFEGTYEVQTYPRDDGDNKRAIYKPEGWTVTYTNGESNDITSLNSNCYQWNNFSTRQQPMNGGNNVYWIRYRWGSNVSIKLSQTANLPAGTYRLSADAFWIESSSIATISAGGQSITIDSRNAWANYAVVFSLTSAMEVEFAYTFTQNAQAECIAGVDNFKLEKYDAIAANDLSWDWTDMIANAGFELGTATSNGGQVNAPYGFTTTATLSGWINSQRINANPSEGSYAFELWAGNVSSIDLSQTINLPMGKYTLSGDLRVDNADNITNQGVYATVDGTTHKSETISSIASTWNSVEGWNTLSQGFYVSNDNSSVTLGVSSTGSGSGSGGWFQIDKITLTYHGSVAKVAGNISFDEDANVLANYWYAVPVSSAGEYTVSSTVATTIYYTSTGYESPDDVTAYTTISAGSKGSINTTSADVIYLRSTANTTIKVFVESFSYTIGDATIDKTFVQPGQSVTVTFPEANSNDPSVSLTQDYSGVKLNGTALMVIPGEKGFTFTVPSLAANGTYTLSIPAGAVAYSGHATSTAQTLTLKTPAVYDGTYFMQAQDGRFLARGSNWETHAMLDDWGLPVNITTDSDNASTIQFADNSNYLFRTGWDAYTDAGTTGSNTRWQFTLNEGKYRLASMETTGLYTKYNTGEVNVFTDGSDSNPNIIEWTLQSPADHTTAMAALRTAATSLESSTEGLTSKTYLTINPTATDEQYQGSGNILSKSIDVYPGIYKFSIQAFHRISGNAEAQALHTMGADCPPVYAFFGNAKLQLKSVYDEYPSGDVGTANSYNGHNYPNGQVGALIAFKEGLYTNTIYVQVTEAGTLNYGIQNQGKAGENAHWTCWATDGIGITRYYNPETDGLDEEDQLIANLRYTIGDVNEDGDVSIADVTSLVNIILGKATEYRQELADVNEDGDISIADVTSLVNIILGKQEAKVVDLTWTYADINATIYAEQSASENANGAGYAKNSAVCTLTNEDVSDKYTDIKDYLTTLNIGVSLSNVASISVYAKGKENIAGLMTINSITKAATYSAGSTPSSYVNHDRDDVNGKNMQSDVVTVTGSNAGTYVAYLLPIDLPNGVTVTVRDSNGKFYSQDFTNIEAGKENNLTFTTTTATNNWMATIPGNVNFSMLSTPGSHNSATSDCGSAAKCQSESIAQQLANGVRAFDLRPGYKYKNVITVDNLYIYHGIYNTEVLYKDAIRTMVEFLQAHPTEAISVIMVKEDGTPLLSSWTDYTTEMCNAIDEIHSTYTDNIKLLDHSYYTLDDFRGKIFFGYRNAWDLHKTVRVTNWPDDKSVTDYSVGVGGTCSASVEDAYNTSGDSKKSVVNALLNLASANTNRSRFHYTFTSVANSITSSANTQNPAAASYISGTLTGPAGYVYADFMGSSSYSGQALLKAVIEQNYKYVFKGRSRLEQ